MPHATVNFPTLVLPLYASPAPAWDAAKHGPLTARDVEVAALALRDDQPDFWKVLLAGTSMATDPATALLQGAASLYAAMTRAGGRS